MNGKVALDTSVAIAFMRGQREAAQYVANAQEIFVSSIVIGELSYGAEISDRPLINHGHIEQFESLWPVVNCDADTGRIYGRIKALLRKRGQMIPDNDMWIAAHTLQYAAKLATFDAHFSVVEGLQTESF